jgi:sigma-B regulation protein RsbU (phosphoserine phosphatase)
MTDRALTILVIDDEAGIRESIGAYLEDSGYLTLEAENGQVGIELLKQEKPDLVLTDLQMPVMGGLQILAAMSANFSEIPVIIVSGQGELSDAIQALKLGAWDYLTKPIQDMAVLEHAVERSLERGRLLRENKQYQERLENTVARLRETLDTLQEDEEAGKRIQFQLLPDDEVAFGSVLFQRRLLPSSSLSGDFVDYFRIDDKHLGFYLADVSGHGVSSSLITVILQNSMSHYLMDCWQHKSGLILDPAAVLQELNRVLLGKGLEKHLTMFYGIVDLEANVLRFANAGQFPFPILFDGEEAIAIGDKSMPVGLFRHAQYKVQEQALSERFLLVLCSDGVLELMPQSQVEEKEAELVAMVADLDLGMEQVISSLGVMARQDNLPDDVTLLMVRR